MRSDAIIVTSGKSPQEVMMIAETEQLLSLAEARLLFPGRRPGKRIDLATVHRWCTRGVLSRSGDRTILESWMIGGQRCTSREAISRFLSRLNPDVALPSARSAAARRAASEAAEAELDRMLAGGGRGRRRA